jgi:hypothetical protein
MDGYDYEVAMSVDEDNIIKGLLDARCLKRPGNGFGVSQQYAEIGDKGCLNPLTQKTAIPHAVAVLEIHHPKD